MLALAFWFSQHEEDGKSLSIYYRLFPEFLLSNRLERTALYLLTRIHIPEENSAGDYVGWISQQEKRKGGEVVAVYVGDAPADLFVMYEADLELVFGRRLDYVCRRSRVPIRKGIREGFVGTRWADVRSLFEIAEWKEIRE